MHHIDNNIYDSGYIIRPGNTRLRKQQLNNAVATGTVPCTLLETLQVRYRIFSRKQLEYGTVTVTLYTTDMEPYL